MTDILLEVTRAAILAILLVWLVLKGRSHLTGNRNSWNTILIGFSLLLFGSVLDVTDNYPSLNHFVVIGDTEVEAFLEKFVGFLGGFLLVAIGLIRWLPSVKESELQLEDSRRALEKSNQAKDEFLASMSHELRTPLATIIGNCELLLEYTKDPQCDELIRTIDQAGKNQLALVNDILDLSKIEAGKFTVDEAPYNLCLLLDGVEKMFQTKAKDQGVNLQVDYLCSERYLQLGDGQRVGQILINLLDNAIKFTEQGSVKLTVWSDQRHLFFKVEDTGIGMSPEMLDNLFGRFQQADGSISRRFGGSGLGLYISLNLAEMMDGTIDVSSEVGKGSVFQFHLPYRESDMPMPIQKAEPTKKALFNHPFSGEVLIAEDTLELQMLEQRILESFGVTVTIAATGEEAVELAQSRNFDLILMDMQMPVMDGITATRVLRENGNSTPIVPLTANVMKKHRDAFAAAGCVDFLEKPINRDALQRVLNRYLKLA